jgi:hypothetical protein
MYNEIVTGLIGVTMAVFAIMGGIVVGRALVPFRWSKILLPALLIFGLFVLLSVLVVVFLLWAGAASPGAEPVSDWMAYSTYAWVPIVGIVVPLFAFLKSREIDRQ